MAYRATRAYIEAFISALSNRTDITFIEGNSFGVNLKTKTFVYDPILLQEATIDEVKGILLHEVGHLNYTTDIPKRLESKEFKKYRCLSYVYNALEDIRVEHRMIQEFRRFADGPIGETRLYGAYRNYEMLQKGLPPQITGYKIFIGALLAGLYTNDTAPLKYLERDITQIPFYYDITQYTTQILSFLRQQKTHNMKEANLGVYFNKLNSFEWFIEQIDKCSNTIEVMKLADKYIVPHIRDLLEEQEEQDKATGKMAKALHGAMKALGKMKKEEGGASGKKEGDEDFRGSDSLLDDLIKGSKTGIKDREAKIPSDGELKAVFSMQIRTLTKHLGSILEERTTIKYSGAYKRGKLLPRNVYKARTNEPRMYSKRRNFDTPHYEVSFILDESGSMGRGERYENVYTAGFVINKAVQALKFKINYVSFDGEVRDHEEYSSMRDFHGGGNDENQVLRHIEKRLDYKNDQIIFLLTDGGVESDNSPTPMLKKFKKLGVHVIPIGISIPESQEREFKRWYPESVLIKSMDQLVKAMADYLKTIIHR